MDIYFCDLCGSRATSADLKSGQGMRRGEDVICGSCVELDQGQRWLAGHQSAAAPIAKPLEAPSRIDVARDRAPTMDKDLASAPVQPVVIPAPSAAAPELKEPFDAAPADLEDGYDITTKLPAAKPDFSSAANSFMALGQNNNAEEVSQLTQADDLHDEQSPGQPISAMIHKEDSPKAEGSSAPNKSRSSRSEIAGSSKPSSGRVSKPKTSSTKIASNRTSRSAAQGNRSSKQAASSVGNPMVVKGLMIFSVVAIILSAVLLLMSRGGKHVQTTTEPETVNLSSELVDSIRGARSEAQAALQKRPPVQGDLEHALSRMLNVRDQLVRFGEEAKAKANYTDEQVSTVLQNAGWQDTQLLIRNINDELAKIRFGHK